MNIDKFEKMVGLPHGTTDEVLKEIRANTAKLDACSLPHDFSPDDNPNKFKAKFHCSKCGGTVDLSRGVWYNRGLEDASKGIRE